jgi:outer membrane beta-barrel protein
VNKAMTLSAYAVAIPMSVAALPALAQVQPNTHEVDVFVGALFGDDATDLAISGSTPELDDDVSFGARYTYNFTNVWGLELSAGYNPNSITGLPGGDVDLDLTTVEADAVWNFNLTPDSRLVGYLLGGVGYAIADLDRPIQGTFNGQPVSIDDDDGFTLNAGLGARYFATDQLVFRLEGRYHYFDKIVDNFDDSLNAFSTNLSVGWSF